MDGFNHQTDVVFDADRGSRGGAGLMDRQQSSARCFIYDNKYCNIWHSAILMTGKRCGGRANGEEKMTKRGVLMVMTNPVEGREKEYNDWYNEVHLVDVLKIPGIVRAKRYRIAPEQHAQVETPWRYLALYLIESEDITSVARDLGNRRATSAMPVSPALADARLAWFFEEIHDRPQGAGVSA